MSTLDEQLDQQALEQGRATVAATVSIHLTADSGYMSHETARISADQWMRICRILAEPNEAS